MSIQAMSWVMTKADVRPHGELAVLYALADRAHDNGTCAWPAQSWIAYRARCSTRSVRNHLAALEERGVIRRGNPAWVQHIRVDRRPIVWDLNFSAVRSDPDPSERPENLGRNSGRQNLPAGKSESERPENLGRAAGNPFPTNRPEPSLEPSNTPYSPPADPKPKKKPRRRLTDDWEPRPDIREALAVECPTVDQDHELNLFRDHYIAKDQTSTDWNRNYRSWIRRAKGWQETKTAKPQKADSIKNTLLGMFDNPQEGKQLEWPNSGQQ